MTGRYSDEELEAAVEALTDPERFREAEALVAKVAPALQRVLASALEAGGWFGESQESAVRDALGSEDPSERIRRIRTLLAEEARVSMFVGVAVGWALREELGPTQEE
ncbi:MAG TPA: hypothetical protein VIL04_07660 [Solirubrobacterales bacterium]|jgi:hypothetical protein